MNLIVPRGPADDQAGQATPAGPEVRPRPWAARILAVAVAGGLVLVATACGSSSPSTSPSTTTAGSVVHPPAVPLQGCNYVLNGVVPPGEPAGIQPDFPTFTPDQAAQSAISHIATHGGIGLVDGFTLPPGVKLFAGPDTGQPPVATVPLNRSILAEDPVLWTSGTGAQWIAFFVACGGQHLYWVSIDQIGRADAGAGAEAVRTIANLEGAPPYTQTGRPSMLPVKIVDGQITWNAPAGTHALVPPARGQLLGF